MKRANTTKNSSKSKDKIDWTAFDAMTPAQRSAAARADPDAQPLTPERVKKLRRVPRVKTLRRALKLSQEQFAEKFELAIGTVRDWEQGRKEPDTAAKAYLRVIAADADYIHQLLLSRHYERISYHQAEIKKAIRALQAGEHHESDSGCAILPFEFQAKRNHD